MRLFYKLKNQEREFSPRQQYKQLKFTHSDMGCVQSAGKVSRLSVFCTHSDTGCVQSAGKVGRLSEFDKSLQGKALSLQKKEFTRT